MKLKALAPIIFIGSIVASAFYCIAFCIAFAANDALHNASNNISCGSCHGEGILNSPFWGGSYTPATPDDTIYNNLCRSCHTEQSAGQGGYPETKGPLVKTHSDYSITGGGSWKRECRDCHNPHYQRQKVYKNTDANNLYLAKGKIISCEYTCPVCPQVIGTTALTFSTITYKSGWEWNPPTNTKLAAKTGDYRGAILFPNIGKLGYNYPITAVNPGANTITVKGNAAAFFCPSQTYTCNPPFDPSNQFCCEYPDDPSCLSLQTYSCNLSSPIDFGVIYGQYIKDVIDISSDGSGNNKTVKFFDQTGTNSFADGDTTINGICEVCHTLAGIGVHSGLGGGKCTVCHNHTDGFAPFNHLAEGAVAPAAACIVCHEGDPVSDVHGNNCGLCHVDSNGAGPLVEPYETSHPDGGQCTDCHDWSTGSHDEVSHIATPGQGWVLVFAVGDHDSEMDADGWVLVDCNRCHTMDVKAAHAQLCNICHLSPVDSLGTWNGGCQQGGCHTTYHAQSNVAHLPFGDDNDDCTLCHENGSWNVPQTNCSNCHASPGSGPLVTTSNAKTAPPYNGAAVIDFTVNFGAQVGIGFTFYRLDGGEVQTGSSLIVTENGPHNLEFWTIDQSGREELPHKTATFTVIEDTTPPVTTSNAQATYWQNALITLTATDASDQGVKGTYYRLDGGVTQKYTDPIYVQGVSGTVDDPHTLEFWSDDWSDNEELPHHTAEFTITAGTATLHLVWGDSDTSGSPCPGDPNAYMYWEIRRGSTLVSQGGSACPSWSGVDDIVVPVHGTPYYVDIFWWDSGQGLEECTSYPTVYATTPGETITLSY